MNGGTPARSPGWYARLIGDRRDLDAWELAFAPPSEPQVVRAPDSTTVLGSDKFASLLVPREVRRVAREIVNGLTVTMARTHAALPVKVMSVFEVREDGGAHHHMSLFSSLSVGDGPPQRPATPLDARKGMNIEDRIQLLLAQVGESSEWLGVYKTLERAEDLVGGQHKLRRLLKGRAADYERLRETANFYRHAIARAPSDPVALAQAPTLLDEFARAALSASPGPISKPIE